MKKFLIIRLDKIGDLICTTPLLSALRKHYPKAHIAALVNDYNAPVLNNNADIDAVYIYSKNDNKWFFLRFLLFLFFVFKLRRKKFDYAILANANIPLQERGVRFAVFFGIKNIVSYVAPNHRLAKYVNHSLPYVHKENRHHVERVFNLLTTLGISGKPEKLSLFPDIELVKKIKSKFFEALPDYVNIAPIGVHISARKDSNRWPAERFSELIQALWEKYRLPIILFWAPNTLELSKLHPGDDEKALEIMSTLSNIPIFACATQQLPELIAGLSLSRSLICSDGGAMHIAAALDKPMVCFFGDTNAVHWHPWCVKHVLLQPSSLNVSHISVGEALNAYESLQFMR